MKRRSVKPQAAGKKPTAITQKLFQATVGAPKKATAVREARLMATKLNYADVNTITFPTDKWGLTTELKAACIKLAKRMGTHKDKRELYEATMALLVKHIDAVYEAAGKTEPLKRRSLAPAASAEAKEVPAAPVEPTPDKPKVKATKGTK